MSLWVRRSLLFSALESLVSNGYEVVAVYTQPDKASGRGRIVEESPVKKAALKLNLNVLQPANLKSVETRAQSSGTEAGCHCSSSFRADSTTVRVGNPTTWVH